MTDTGRSGGVGHQQAPADPTDAHFGEQGGRLTYGAYLQLAELLSAQLPESVPPAHDELLFITIHQAYELWFKLLLHELTDARDRMLAGETYLPRTRLERCQVIQRLLVNQVDVIDTLTPQDFLAFRNKLSPAYSPRRGFPSRPPTSVSGRTR
jgi:tryptophan 2,3-dioxygenase